MTNKPNLPAAQAAELEQLTTDAREHHLASQHDMRSALMHCIAAGACYSKIREIVGHGRWIAYIEEHIDASDRQVRRCVSLFKDRAKFEQIGHGVANLTIREAEALTRGSRKRRPAPKVIEGKAVEVASEPTASQQGEINIEARKAEMAALDGQGEQTDANPDAAPTPSREKQKPFDTDSEIDATVDRFSFDVDKLLYKAMDAGLSPLAVFDLLKDRANQYLDELRVDLPGALEPPPAPIVPVEAGDKPTISTGSLDIPGFLLRAPAAPETIQ
jgi:hypothetical protein